MGKRKDFPLDDLVRDAEAWQTSMHLPAPVHRRLEGLVDCAIEAGEPKTLSRAELMAALICAAPEDGKALRKYLDGLRLAKVRDIVLRRESVAAGANVITLEARRPGRRAR